ncbi:unnamed protein product [Brassica rapa subsp. narinosa]
MDQPTHFGLSYLSREVDNECYTAILWLVKDKINDGITLTVKMILLYDTKGKYQLPSDI